MHNRVFIRNSFIADPNNLLFCHLHTHSHYSFLEGIPSPEELAGAASRLDMPAVALTDHLALTGILSFYRACMKEGIKPVIGLEIDCRIPSPTSSFKINTPSRLVLLAIDQKGLRNLYQLSSSILIKDNNHENHLCEIDQLATYHEGLICLTGGKLGLQKLISQTSGDKPIVINFLKTLKEIFPSRIYVELNQHLPEDKELNDIVSQLAILHKLPLVAAHSVYYIEPEQASLQETVSSIRQNRPIDKLAPEHKAPPKSSFLSSSEMLHRFSSYSGAIENTVEIINRCSVEFSFTERNFPTISTQPGISAVEQLRQMAIAGAKKLYSLTRMPGVIEQLEHELSVISAKGYAPIFLIAAEMMNYAKEHGIPFASRGSASSSLVAHCIGITTPDPIDLDLYFERFLNPARSSPPDIDTDFCSRRRDEIIDHIFKIYGEDRVAMVGTINTLRPRSALGEVAKAHGIDIRVARNLTKRLSYRHFYRGKGENDGIENEQNPYTHLINQFSGNKQLEIIFKQAFSIIGKPHHLSIHPGGVVIAPGPIANFVPVSRSGGKGMIITQFDLNDVEQSGLVKLDILGIRGLTVLGDVAERIFSWKRKEYQTPFEVLDSIPQVDSDTSAMLATGQTIGCFQIESPGMRATLRDIHACSPRDIMAALALYRPGPLRGGLHDTFIRRYKGEEAVTHIHPALSDLLHETYGVILYQEQVLRIAHNLAGLSLAEADLLRRAMSHFDPGKQMQILRDKFINGANKVSAIPTDTAMYIWEMMAAFAGYGFPKAHAASYAQVAWRSVWCKTHYPAEFIASVLANWGGYYPQSVYLNEARRLKISVHAPHINFSQYQFTARYPNGEPALFMGLDQVRDLTARTQERIIRYRPYHSLAEFIAKVDPRKVELENLVSIGAFDGIGIIPDLLSQMSEFKHSPAQLSLFHQQNFNQEDWTLEQKCAAQMKILNVRLAAHPLELNKNALIQAGGLTTVEAATRDGQFVKIAGICQDFRRNLTSTNDWIGNFVLEDLEGILTITIHPDLFRRYRNILRFGDALVMVEGLIERDPITGEPILIAKRITRID